jgi:hypothetical protein
MPCLLVQGEQSKVFFFVNILEDAQRRESVSYPSRRELHRVRTSQVKVAVLSVKVVRLMVRTLTLTHSTPIVACA